MRFGDKYRGVRKFGLLPDMNRKQIRDYMRSLQLRNDGTWKETRPQPPAEKHGE